MLSPDTLITILGEEEEDEEAANNNDVSTGLGAGRGGGASDGGEGKVQSWLISWSLLFLKDMVNGYLISPL